MSYGDGALLAHSVAKLAYGVDGTNKTTAHLTEVQKDNIKAISQLGAATAGGVIGDSSQSAVSSMQIAQRAVENNYLFIDEAKERATLREKVNNGTASERDKTRLAELGRLDVTRDQSVIAACQDNPLSTACRSEMAGVERAYTDYFHHSTQSNIYGYPTYTRTNLLYAEETNKVAGFADEYDLQKALKDKNIRDIAKVYNWDENTLRKVDAWSQVGSNIAAGWAGHKVAKGALDKPQSIPKEANANSKLPPVGKTEGYENANINILGYPATSNKVRDQLKAELAFKEAHILNNDGKLTESAITNSRLITLTDGVIKNPSIVAVLTRDGSK